MLRYLVPSNWISYVIERRTSKRCKKIIAISKKISKELIEFYNISPSKITLIYPATNLQKFRPLNEKEKSRLRKKLEFKDEQFIIVFIGYHFLRKGGDLLLDAIRMLRYRYPQIQTIFIGSEKRTEKNCTFLTDVSDVETYYGIADAFVFPTKYEPFGYVTLEAMACGLPVIVSPPQYNGAAEIINNKQNGILLKDLTAHEVAKEIETLIKNPHIRKKIGREARKVALHYNWAYFVKNTQTVYSETK
jgi:UDP-glucose:(heptosyl)LPS alpha-1,3-glucosyltransferase